MSALSSALLQRIERFTRVVGVTRRSPHPRPVVVLVPPPAIGAFSTSRGSSLAEGFVLARDLIDRGEAVHLIGHGSTISADWPDWVRSNDVSLTCSELGAYRIGNPSQATRRLASDVLDWIGGIFEPALGKDAGAMLYASAASRLFEPLFEAVPYLDGINAACATRRTVCTDRAWAGLALLHSERKTTSTMSGLGWWPVYLSAYGIYSIGRVAASQIAAFVRAKRSRAFLHVLRGTNGRKGDPEIWAALIPDWQRINRHVIESVVQPALAASKRVGLLLCTTLQSGERIDDAMLRRQGQTLWPGIRPIDPASDVVSVEQAVGPETWSELRQLLAAGALSSLRIMWRLARHGPVVNNGSLQMDLRPRIAGLSRLATTDLWQALASREAVRRVACRHNLAGVPIVFSALNLTETAAAEAALRKAGAVTIDFLHGAGGDNWYGQGESFSSWRAVWTSADAETCRVLGNRSLIVPPPIRCSPCTRDPDGALRRLLVVSNLVHGDTALAGFPFRPFQTELLRGVDAIMGDGRLVRWRPHPNDDRGLIELAHRAHPRIELSLHTDLAEDLAWADLAICSPTSAIVDAVRMGLPIFVQVPPAFLELQDLAALAPDRRFFYAEELAERFASYLRLRSENPRAAALPDERLRTVFFPADAPSDVLTAMIQASLASMPSPDT